MWPPVWVLKPLNRNPAQKCGDLYVAAVQNVSAVTISFSLCVPPGKTEEDVTASPLADDGHLLFPLCHLSHFLLFLSSTPVTFPPTPSSLHDPLLLSLAVTAEATRLAVAGQTEPSQVFLWGLVPFNQLLRREFSQQTPAWNRNHSGVVACAVFCRGGSLLTLIDLFFSLGVFCLYGNGC